MIEKMFEDIAEEYQFATNNFKPFNSAHEGLAVIWEEFDELKDEVFLKQIKRSPSKMRAEAIQLATMAIRFIIDVIDTKEEGIAGN